MTAAGEGELLCCCTKATRRQVASTPASRVFPRCTKGGFAYCILPPSHVHLCLYVRHPPCPRMGPPRLPPTSAHPFFEITKAPVSQGFYSGSRWALKSDTRLLSCYLVISLYSPPPRNTTQHPEGYNKYPGPSLSSITRGRQWRRARGMVWGGGKKRAHFMFELEQRGVSR